MAYHVYGLHWKYRGCRSECVLLELEELELDLSVIFGDDIQRSVIGRDFMQVNCAIIVKLKLSSYIRIYQTPPRANRGPPDLSEDLALILIFRRLFPNL